MLVAILIVGLLIGWYVARRSPSTGTIPTGTQNQGQGTSSTHSELDGDIRVPEAGETVSGDVAVPLAVVDAAPGVDAKRRTFEVTLDGSSFSPAQVIVYAGDTTSIRFKTTAGTCAFSQPDLGLSSNFTTDKEQLIEITPDRSMSGKFAFFCTNLGGPEGGPIGYLVVAPKQ